MVDFVEISYGPWIQNPDFTVLTGMLATYPATTSLSVGAQYNRSVGYGTPNVIESDAYRATAWQYCVDHNNTYVTDFPGGLRSGDQTIYYAGTYSLDVMSGTKLNNWIGALYAFIAVDPALPTLGAGQKFEYENNGRQFPYMANNLANKIVKVEWRPTISLFGNATDTFTFQIRGKQTIGSDINSLTTGYIAPPPFPTLTQWSTPALIYSTTFTAGTVGPDVRDPGWLDLTAGYSETIVSGAIAGEMHVSLTTDRVQTYLTPVNPYPSISAAYNNAYVSSENTDWRWTVTPPRYRVVTHILHQATPNLQNENARSSVYFKRSTLQV